MWAWNWCTFAQGQLSLAITMRSNSALWQQLTGSLRSLARSQGTHSMGWCQAEGCRNGRSAPNPMGSCCCKLRTYSFVKRVLTQKFNSRFPLVCKMWMLYFFVVGGLFRSLCLSVCCIVYYGQTVQDRPIVCIEVGQECWDEISIGTIFDPYRSTHRRHHRGRGGWGGTHMNKRPPSDFQT